MSATEVGLVLAGAALGLGVAGFVRGLTTLVCAPKCIDIYVVTRHERHLSYTVGYATKLSLALEIAGRGQKIKMREMVDDELRLTNEEGHIFTITKQEIR